MSSFPIVAPHILDPPDDLTFVEPQDAIFSCLATGRPRPDIVWTRLSDMVQLQPQPGEFIIAEQEIGDRERQSNLTILGTQLSDAGMYACVAMNEPGTDTEQATLTVHGKPDHKLIVNTAVYFKCSGYNHTTQLQTLCIELFILFSSHTQHNLPCGRWLRIHCE